MSHYLTDYANLPPAEKAAKALADVKSYMGTKWEWLLTQCKLIWPDRPGEDEFRNAMAIYLGIEGYPILPLMDHIWPPVPA